MKRVINYWNSIDPPFAYGMASGVFITIQVLLILFLVGNWVLAVAIAALSFAVFANALMAGLKSR